MAEPRSSEARRPSPDSVRSARLPAFERAVEVRTLGNGMSAVHVPDPHHDGFTVGVVARGGARLEPATSVGIAHFLEHVLFRGSERHPEYTELAAEFEWLGGDWNAATGHEQTEYAYAGIRGTAAEAIDLFAEFLERPRLADVDVERNVILRELEGETNEFGHSTDLDLHVLRLLWPGSALARPILGTKSSLRRIDRDALVAWRDRHYVPANLAVYAAGGDPGDGTLDRLARAFDAHRAAFVGREGSAFRRLPPPRGGVRWVEDGDNEHGVQLSFPCGGENDPDAFVREVLVRILGDGFCARLPRRLREELGLVYDISAQVAHLTDVGTVDLHAAVRPDQFDTFFGELFAELRRLVEDGPDADETARAILRAAVDLDRTPEDPEGAASRVAWDRLCGRSTSWLADRKRIETVTPGDVRRVASGLFRADRAALVMLGPGERDLDSRLRQTLDRGLPGTG